MTFLAVIHPQAPISLPKGSPVGLQVEYKLAFRIRHTSANSHVENPMLGLSCSSGKLSMREEVGQDSLRGHQSPFLLSLARPEVTALPWEGAACPHSDQWRVSGG